MALQQLRSSTANKRPTAGAMSDGQLAVNTNATNPGLFFKDADGSVRKVGPVFIGSAAPNASPASGGSTGHSVGEQWLDNSGGTYVLKIWDGTAWRSESGTFVDVSGDNMTGNLTLGTNQVILNASNGAGTFAGGDLTINNSGNLLSQRSGSTGFVDLNSTGLLKVRGAASSSVFTIEDSATSSATVSVLGNGAATFTNEIKVEGSNTPSGLYSGISKYGSLLIGTSSEAVGNARLAVDSGNGNITSVGSATFGGGITSGGDNVIETGSINVYQSSNSTATVWNGGFSVGGSRTITSSIRSNGSAVFQAGVDVRTQDGQRGFTVNSSSSSQNQALKINNNGGSQVILFNHDGSASLAASNTDIAATGQLTIKKTAPFTDPSFRILDRNNSNANGVLMYGDGTATFAGRVDTGSSTLNNAALVASANHATKGVIQAYHYNNGSVWVAGGADGVTKSEITAAGAATFDGGIVTKQEVYVQGTTTSTQRYLNFQDAGTSNYRATLRRDAWYLGAPVTNIGDVTPSGANIVLNMNGAATFQNTVLVNRTSGTATCFQATLSGSTKVTINADGSATFANTIKSGGPTIIGGTNLGSQIGHEGNAAFCSGSTSSAIRIFKQGTSAATVDILGNGTATFAGDGHFKCGGTAHADMGVQFVNDGEVKIYRPTGGGGAVNLISGSAGVGSPSEQFSVKADGTASFNGNVTSKATFLTELQSGYSATGSAFKVFSGSSTFVDILNNGSATFSERIMLGTTTEGKSGADELTVATSSNTGITIRSGTSSTGDIMFSDGTSGDDEFRGIVRYDHSNNSMQLWSNSSERLRLTSHGRLDVFTSSSADVSILSSAGSAGTSLELISGRHSASSTGTGTKSFVVYTNGNVQNTNDSYGQISDVKLKENIVDAPSQWEDFKAVRFRKYNFKEETGHETYTQLGVIAQELELISPGLVYETPDVDDEGNDLGTTTKAVKSSVLTKKALVALQEAMDRIETLEAKVAALEAG